MELILKKDDIIDEKTKDKLEKKGIKTVKVRSPLICNSLKGICKKCYGCDLSKRAEPQRGFTAGIMAAEVIGERATQDAMRTYHVGTATGTVTLFDKVKAIFDNAIDPDIKNRVSDRVRDINDLAITLYNYYEKKVDIKHYEVMLRALMLRALMKDNKYAGSKGAIEHKGFLHKASFERMTEVFKEAANNGNTYSIEGIFEKLFI